VRVGGGQHRKPRGDTWNSSKSSRPAEVTTFLLVQRAERNIAALFRFHKVQPYDTKRKLEYDRDDTGFM
jgi:hypothetical protein